MAYDVEISKLFKENENIDRIGAIIGTVVDSNNLTVSILDGKALLTKKQIYVCSGLLKDYIREMQTSTDKTTWSTEYYTKFTKDFLKKGDTVMLIATEDDQKFFLVDKVVI